MMQDQEKPNSTLELLWINAEHNFCRLLSSDKKTSQSAKNILEKIITFESERHLTFDLTQALTESCIMSNFPDVEKNTKQLLLRGAKRNPECAKAAIQAAQACYTTSYYKPHSRLKAVEFIKDVIKYHPELLNQALVDSLKQFKKTEKDKTVRAGLGKLIWKYEFINALPSWLVPRRGKAYSSGYDRIAPSL